MRRITAIAVMSLFVLASSSPVLAQNPSFNKLDASISSTTLTVTFKLTGLGNATTVDVTLTGGADFTCTSHGHDTQITSAHQTINQTTTFNVGPKPGTTSGSVSFTVACPGNQTESGALFTNVFISGSASTGSTGSVQITNSTGQIIL